LAQADRAGTGFATRSTHGGFSSPNDQVSIPVSPRLAWRQQPPGRSRTGRTALQFLAATAPLLVLGIDEPYMPLFGIALGWIPLF
jgi:hypothetical protein